MNIMSHTAYGEANAIDALFLILNNFYGQGYDQKIQSHGDSRW